MKKILLLLAMLPMMFFTACSSDDDEKYEPADLNSKEYKEWLDKNLVGTWKVTDVWNSISGVWVDASYGFKDSSFTFKANKTVDIVNFNIDNGSSIYKVHIKDNAAYIEINGTDRGVLTIDYKTPKLTLFNYGKLEKVE